MLATLIELQRLNDWIVVAGRCVAAQMELNQLQRISFGVCAIAMLATS